MLLSTLKEWVKGEGKSASAKAAADKWGAGQMKGMGRLRAKLILM